MSEQKTIDINLVEVVNLAAKILDEIFLKSSKDKSKKLFKDLKAGKSISLGDVTIQESIKSPLLLALDYSEYRGPGFNYDAVETALKGILTQVSQKFQAKADLNIMTSEEGTALIHFTRHYSA